MSEPQYYILDGVHRSVAARELGVAELPAKLFVAGRPPREMNVRVAPLHSPLDSVDRLSRRFFDILQLVPQLAAGRSDRRILIEPLGARGQTGSFPIRQVRLEP